MPSLCSRGNEDELGHLLAFESAANKTILIVNHIHTYLSIEYTKTTEDGSLSTIVTISIHIVKVVFLYFYRGALLQNHSWLLILTRQSDLQCDAVISKIKRKDKGKRNVKQLILDIFASTI